MKTSILQFSGGKDSLAVLYLSRPFLDSIVVYFADTGATVPHVLQYVKDTCAKLGADLRIIEPIFPVQKFTVNAGLPSDLVPIWTDPRIQEFMKDKAPQRVISAMDCCAAMIFSPMHRAVLDSGIKMVIRGAKLADARRGVAPGYFDEHGITYMSPIWDWSDEKVFAYLKSEGAELAPHYGQVKSSMDCWLCTAHLSYDDGRNKIAYIKEHYPELWPELERRLKALRHTVSSEVEKMNQAMWDVI